jgi:HAD superfamily hydrolase (TIGR01509 family)
MGHAGGTRATYRVAQLRLGPPGAHIADRGLDDAGWCLLNGPVIFDLDGVLVDSEIWWDEVRQAFASAHDREWGPDDQAAVMGANSAAWSRTMRDRLALDLEASVIERAIVDGVIERYRRDGPPTIPGAVEAVERIAAERPVAVASSAHREVIDAALQATGLATRFEVVVSSDEVEHGKPAPDVYLETARRLGTTPEACLVVEDSRNGVLAARAAGMTVVLVPNESVPPAPGTHGLADVVLERLADLDPATVMAGAGARARARTGGTATGDGA